jgi:hypothetical protein
MARDLASRHAGNPVRNPRGQLLLLLLSLHAFAACSTPTSRIGKAATGLGFTQHTVDGTQFSHAVFTKTAGTPGSALHVYLDGDGSPWIRGRWIAKDPTPADPFTLQLMAADPSPAVYVGRPCYHGLVSPACTQALWTSARYSETVVASMAAAVSRVRARHGTPDLVLVGYSGGGTLAMLVAGRLPNVRAVVTIAANLDVDSWSELHGYLPLAGSLNPARSAPLHPDIVQMHYAGAKDENVPPGIVVAVASAQANATVTVVPGFDHRCCWLERWPEMLGRLNVLRSASGAVTKP